MNKNKILFAISFGFLIIPEIIFLPITSIIYNSITGQNFFRESILLSPNINIIYLDLVLGLQLFASICSAVLIFFIFRKSKLLAYPLGVLFVIIGFLIIYADIVAGISSTIGF